MFKLQSVSQDSNFVCSCRLNMEIPISQYGNVSFDAIRSRCKFSLDKRSSLFRCSLPFNRRKWGLVKCSSSVEEALRPRPTPIRKVEIKIVGEEGDTQPRKTNPWICGQIEKMVLQGRYREALEFFEDLELDGNVEIGGSTYDALISACIGSKSVGGVKRVHNYMIKLDFEQDLYIRNRVLLMHVKCRMMLDARRLFDEMPEKNLVSWNTIIGALIDAGDLVEAFQLFFDMLDDFSEVESWLLATMLRASAQLGSLTAGKQLHSFASKLGVDKDTFISCTLINMYSKCGSIEEAQYVFKEMPEKTTVGWNTLIAGYALHGRTEEALSVYSEMRDSGVKRDPFTFSVVVSICARLGSVEHAKQAHTDMIRQGFGHDVVANTALVDFYSKWGRIEDARHVFDYMSKKNIKSWNALINGYRHHGKGEEAVQLFEDMIQQGMRPNQVTFLGVLLACSSSGLLDRGWEIFESMECDHKIKPRSMHYTCMIELLGREGLLDEALQLIIDSRCETVNMWAALLTACRVHEKFELGKFAAEKVYGMEPEKLNNYIVLLNIYNRAGQHKEAAEVVNALRKKGLRMVRAHTWIEINKTSHFFLSGDKSHPQSKKIYQKVDELMLEISKHGYVPQEKHFLPDVDENEVKLRFYHSEKLAIAFLLLNLPDWSSLHLIQSHRVCNDCHVAIKMISAVTGREIVMRDSSRFHHFKDGRCSCGDYW